MRTIVFSVLLIVLAVAWPAWSQDSSMVRKPSPYGRRNVAMPTRSGQGTAMPMPSPRYKLRIVPMPVDFNRIPNRRDSTK